MERSPYIRGKTEPTPQPEHSGPRPVLLRKHSTVLPVAKVHHIEPGRILLMPARSDREREAVAGAWEAAGGKVRRVGRFWEPDAALVGKCACLYGNVIFCEVLANVLNLDLVSPADDILARLPSELLGRKIFLSRLDRIDELNYPCFVKSLVPKLFTAGVVGSAQRLSEITVGLDPETELLVSEAVKFQGQARAFICDRKVLDLSLYEGRCKLDGALEVAEAVARLEALPHGFVVDLGLLNGRWVVVEMNPAWAAGLNGCGAEKVMLAIAAGTRA
jgi:hypothetical protein